MIILDTNVVSETLAGAPSPLVAEWMEVNDTAGLMISAPTQAELLFGCARLPGGRRKRALEGMIDRFLGEFHGRILPFDHDCARPYADIVVRRTRLGRPISQFDAMLAAIAVVHGAALATRNTRDFTDCGIRVLNPWKGE